MFPNILIVLASAVIPLFVGFIYYNENVLGKAWMKVSEMTQEKIESAKGARMLVIFGLTFLLSCMFSLLLFSLVVHQTDLYSMVMKEPGFGQEGSDVMNNLTAWMDAYGTNFRTFKHGAFHGVVISLFFALPIIGINALFERRSAKYVFIHLGYWMICLALMGGTLCQWG